MMASKIEHSSILLVLVICSALLCSCHSADSGLSKPISPSEFLSPSKIEDYFSNQIWKYNVVDAPSQMYREYLSEDDLSKTASHFWTLWREANHHDLSGFLRQLEEKPHIYDWALVDEEPMSVLEVAKKAQPVRGYDVFFHLHGGGSYPNYGVNGAPQNETSYTEEFNNALYSDVAAPSLHLVPRLPNDTRGDWALRPVRLGIKRICQILMLSEKVNVNKIFLSGASMGGYGTIDLAAYMPDYFAAVAPIAAAVAPGPFMCNYNNLSLHMEVGRFDSKFLRNIYAAQWQDYFSSHDHSLSPGVSHIVKIRPNEGHSIQIKNLTEILRPFDRQPNPDHLLYYYTNLKGDGYPDAVYYLDFRSVKPQSGASLLFDVKKSNNTFVVSVTSEPRHVGNGTLGLYLDKNIDFSQPVKVILDGKVVFNSRVKPNRGVMAESIALFGDPERIFAAKVMIKI